MEQTTYNWHWIQFSGEVSGSIKNGSSALVIFSVSTLQGVSYFILKQAHAQSCFCTSVIKNPNAQLFTYRAR